MKLQDYVHLKFQTIGFRAMSWIRYYFWYRWEADPNSHCTKCKRRRVTMSSPAKLCDICWTKWFIGDYDLS